VVVQVEVVGARVPYWMASKPSSLNHKKHKEIGLLRSKHNLLPNYHHHHHKCMGDISIIVLI